MMRVCHLNTCPVGVATQDPELRRRFTGQPEHVVNYLFFVAEELRGIMAQLGVRTYDELVGRIDLLAAAAGGRPLEGARRRPQPRCSCELDLPEGTPLSRTMPQTSQLVGSLDYDLIAHCKAALDERAARSRASFPVRNVDRTVGGILSQAITRAWGAEGLPAGTIKLALHRVGRPVVRRLAGAGHRADAVRRRQRLHGQGPVGRRRVRAAAPRRDLRARGERRSSATPSSTARRPGARSTAAWPASASPCATRAPTRSSRASATTAAST